MHAQTFLLNIGIATVAALVGGLAARLLRLPALVGYLVAGVVVGPHTPGVVAESGTVVPAANLGVILLMFAVGVQFSLHELMAARRTALVAGGAQIAGTVALGVLVGAALGWGLYAGLFLGCALALSSTAVVMRLLEERGEVGSGQGVVMMGISVVQDLSLVLMAALLPALASLGASGSNALADVGLAVAKAAAFLAAVVFLAMRGVPLLLDRVARLDSRELFVLTVVVICLGAAIGAEYAGLGLALGAFLAGIVVSESDFAHEVFAQVRPLRDVFAALFFVSVGMLLDPRFALAHAGAVAMVVAVILVGKALLIAVPVYLLGWEGRVALTAGLGMAQIGEFSFVLATLGSARGLIAHEVSSVILAAALVTILLTPFLFAAAGPLCRWLDRFPRLSRALNHGRVTDDG